MNARLERIELVVRNLADRVLGEEYTFDAIAEQEAAEQGVAYVPPPAEPQARHEDVCKAVDAAFQQALPLMLEALRQLEDEARASLLERIAKLEKRVMAQEHSIQEALQTLDTIMRIPVQKAG